MRLNNIEHEITAFGCFLAGGAILSLATKKDIADYDIYPKNKQGFENAIHTLLEDGCFVVNISDRAITLKSNSIKVGENMERAIIQVMTYQYFPTAESIFENFDFTVCMGAYDFDTKKYILHDDFYSDIASKTLRFNNKTRYPLNSMLRVGKYREKGFYMSKPETVKLALTVAQKGMPESWDELEAEIGGAYGREITLMRGDTPYTYEDAIEVLSEMRFDFSAYESDTEDLDVLSKLTAEDIVDYFDIDPVETMEYIEINNDEMTSAKKSNMFLIEDNKLGLEIPKVLIKNIGLPSNYKKVEEAKLNAFILLKRTDAEKGEYTPNNNLFGAVSQTVTLGGAYNAVSSVHLIKNKPDAEDKMKWSSKKDEIFIAKVSFNAGDVMRPITRTSLQVKRFVVEEIFQK